MADTPFKPFAEMREKDYEAVGFKSGLEIHQQLLTAKKLFCRCPAGRYSEAYHAEILRHMRPTLSELGEYDGTALMEFKTKKEIIYRIHHDTVCTYEMDDTPPFEINEEALDIALGIGMLYDCSIVDEMHIARKQYLDGSIPTGFQRTSIVALNGGIPFKGRTVRVIQLSIEEDSCREVSDIGHRRVYLTDRLGMPLIETVTGADMRTPQEVAEVGEICRRLARSTGMVRTGIGAARQDVNVSVTGGTRIEIKGVPRIPRIPLLTYNEAMRQWNLLRLRDELHGRGINETSFGSKTENVTKLLRKTRYQPIENALQASMIVYGVLLRGFKGLLRWQTQTGTFFSKEISDRVRVIACLTTLPNIIHSDSPNETILSSEWQSVRRALGGTEDDTVVLVWGNPVDAEAGVREVLIRAKEATVGVPSETRQALRDGSNGFERILPGPDRMYPDTDLPPKRIMEDRLAAVKAKMPVPVWSREEWYRSLKVPAHLIEPLAESPHANLFEKAVKEWKIDPTLAAVAMIEFPRRLEKESRRTNVTTAEMLSGAFDAFRKGKLVRDGILPGLRALSREGRFAEELLPAPCANGEIAGIIDAKIAVARSLPIRRQEKKNEVIMGLVMDALRGRVNGVDAAARLASSMEKD